MATPRVFISSTCYDLKYIRENLKYFVRTIGYDPVLSDEGDVYYDPSSHTHESCLREVATCQLFVLVIGGRFGGKFKESESSITNHEYREAVRNNIPVFALVESAVHSVHHVFLINKKEKPDFFEKMTYPGVDNIKIFDFLDEVRKSSANNALHPFRDFSDIEKYLKKQWAGMMFDFLDKRTQESQSKITNRLLDDLTLATRKSEELIKILLQEAQRDKAELTIKEVGKRLAGEKFFRLVFSEFNIGKIEGVSVKELEDGLSKSPTWIDYLKDFAGFYISEFINPEGGADHVLFGAGNTGLAIARTEDDGRYTPFRHQDYEQAYAALQSLDKATRAPILRSVISGLDADVQ